MTKLHTPLRALLLTAMLLCPFMAWSDVTDSQLSFSPIYSTDGATVTGYSVSRNADVAETLLAGALVIPSTYRPSETEDPKPVVTIADRAFMNCTKITSVTIPESIDTIGISAFGFCTGLESIVIPNTVKSIRQYAFSSSGIKTITLPNRLTEIPQGMLSSTPITAIDIPETVTKIGSAAFCWCQSLETVEIPAAVDTIYARTFEKCTSLKTVKFNPGLKYIEDGSWAGAFMDCSSLKELVFPETLEYIGDMAFASCRGLETITLPASVADYGTNVFAACSGLKKVINKKTYGVSTYYNLFSTDAEKFVYGNSRYMSIYNNCVLNYPFGGSYWSNPWYFFANKQEGIGNHVLQSAVYSKEAGTYDDAFTLTLTNPNSKGTLYYIINPQQGSTVGPTEYTEPLEISTSCTVKTWISDGDDCSDVASTVYEISGLTIEVAGIQVNSTNRYDVLSDKGSVMFSPDTKTLILHNANINTDSYKSDCGIRAFGDDLTIELNGNNEITSSYLGIDYGYDTGGTLTIRGGDTKEGTPSLTINFEGKYGQAAINLYLANLNIENCNVYLKNFATGIEVKAAPKNGGMLYINNSTLDITSQNAAIQGVYDFNLEKGTVLKLPANGEFVSAYNDDEKEGAKGGICVDGVLQSRVVIGTEVDPIPQIEDEKTIIFSNSLTEGTNLCGTTIDNIYYNLNNEGNGYNASDNCIEITTATSTAALTETPTTVVENPYIPDAFQGMILVIGGKGTIDINCQTSADRQLNVKIGSNEPMVINNPTQQTSQIAYNTSEPVYTYIYATEKTDDTTESAPVKTKVASDGATVTPIKIFSLKVMPTNVITTSIDSVAVGSKPQETVIYDLSGRRRTEPLAPGIYIINGKKVIK